MQRRNTVAAEFVDEVLAAVESERRRERDRGNVVLLQSLLSCLHSQRMSNEVRAALWSARIATITACASARVSRDIVDRKVRTRNLQHVVVLQSCSRSLVLQLLVRRLHLLKLSVEPNVGINRVLQRLLRFMPAEETHRRLEMVKVAPPQRRSTRARRLYSPSRSTRERGVTPTHLPRDHSHAISEMSRLLSEIRSPSRRPLSAAVVVKQAQSTAHLAGTSTTKRDWH
jgi:hypothetical protein